MLRIGNYNLQLSIYNFENWDLKIENFSAQHWHGSANETRSQGELPMVRMNPCESGGEVRTHQSRNIGG